MHTRMQTASGVNSEIRCKFEGHGRVPRVDGGSDRLGVGSGAISSTGRSRSVSSARGACLCFEREHQPLPPLKRENEWPELPRGKSSNISFCLASHTLESGRKKVYGNSMQLEAACIKVAFLISTCACFSEPFSDCKLLDGKTCRSIFLSFSFLLSTKIQEGRRTFSLAFKFEIGCSRILESSYVFDMKWKCLLRQTFLFEQKKIQLLFHDFYSINMRRHSVIALVPVHIVINDTSHYTVEGQGRMLEALIVLCKK